MNWLPVSTHHDSIAERSHRRGKNRQQSPKSNSTVVIGQPLPRPTSSRIASNTNSGSFA